MEWAAVTMTVLCAGGPLGTVGAQAVTGGALLLALVAFLADRGRGVWIVDRAHDPQKPYPNRT
ncbi:hypothetical protein ABZZ74_01130 [Streptomyces sp. NPDC006476]|uniref:hypothetical protein n=1 Tax=Streptomyces sp. NPDC006476 TaxID=3157175 RepID=UPI0033B1C11D